MRKIGFLVILIGISAIGVKLGSGGQAERKSVPLPGPQAEHLSSLNRLLFELAAERHSMHVKRMENWIFTFHNGREVKKFSNRNFIVISLPAESEESKVGLCTYIRQSNALTESVLEKRTREGSYAEAREFYELLLHFDRCGGITRETIQKKLDCVSRIIRNEDTAVNKMRYSELCIQLAAHWNLAQIETLEPVAVTNLLSVDLP